MQQRADEWTTFRVLTEDCVHAEIDATHTKRRYKCILQLLQGSPAVGRVGNAMVLRNVEEPAPIPHIYSRPGDLYGDLIEPASLRVECIRLRLVSDEIIALIVQNFSHAPADVVRVNDCKTS